jgi:hypothetical protein
MDKHVIVPFLYAALYSFWLNKVVEACVGEPLSVLIACMTTILVYITLKHIIKK